FGSQTGDKLNTDMTALTNFAAAHSDIGPQTVTPSPTPSSSSSSTPRPTATPTPTPKPTSTPTPSPKPSVTPSPNPCSGADVNHNGSVDLLDYSIVISNFGKQEPADTNGDINGNGTVDLL